MLVYDVLCDGVWSDCFVLFVVAVFVRVCVICALMCVVVVLVRFTGCLRV